MKYIRKYVRFFENETMVSKKSTTIKPEEKFGYAKESDVVNRLSELYKSLSKDDKNEIDSYFE